MQSSPQDATGVKTKTFARLGPKNTFPCSHRMSLAGFKADAFNRGGGGSFGDMMPTLGRGF